MKYIFRLLIPLVSLFTAGISLHAQTFRVSGVVLDGSTREPLVFASILVQETQRGTVTSDSGRFVLDLAPGEYRLRTSYVGYRAAVVPLSVHEDASIIISLSPLDVLLQDVTVYANYGNDETAQTEVSALSLQSETIGKITGLMPDVLRSVQMLPGVSNDNEFSAKFNVHGGDANENLVLIDGTEVYDPYHVKEAPNASIGIFNVDMIKKMDLITGGFSARYGDKMSSVVDIEYREGSKDRMRGEASVSMTDFDVLLEGPVGSNGSFIIGARQSYLQYELELLKTEPQVHISYDDVQGVLAYQLARGDKMLLKFIRAGDKFTDDPTINSGGSYSTGTYEGVYPASLSKAWRDSSEEHAHYYSTMIAVQNSNIISSVALLNSEVSYYDELDSEHSRQVNLYGDQFHTVTNTGPINAFYNSTSDLFYDNDLRIRTLDLNSSLDMQVTQTYDMKAGLGYQRIYYYQELVNQRTFSYSTNDYYYPKTTDSSWNINALDNAFGSIDAQSYKAAGYLENIFQIGESAVLNVGGRFDYFDLDRGLTWSPRVNLAIKASPELTVRGAWGHFYQSPIYQQLAHSTASDTNTQSQRAIHYVLGVEDELISDEQHHSFLKLKLETYLKTYNDLISATVSSSGRINYSRRNDAIGRASGLDAYLMYSASWFSGWISYSLLSAEQEMVQNDSIGYFPRNTDQKHTLAVVAEFNLGKVWRLGTRIVYGSGYPYTPSVAVYDKSANAWEWRLGNPNSAYLPEYKRVDLRLSNDFDLLGLTSSAFLDISNLFNFTNVQAYAYQFDNQGNPRVVTKVLYPILPTLGMTVRF